MKKALCLAKKGEGFVSPNPMVGCVIVKNNAVVAQGWHQQYGCDHAEIVALKKINFKALGMTMYVTLEPCCHWGKTPPCVDVVIASGVKRVVVAMKDPHCKVNGKSLKMMKEAGIEVVVGVLEQEARWMNRVFIKHIKTGMPFVVAKIAQTLDGKIATRQRESKWITSNEARMVSKKRRNYVDAMLVGINTVLFDDPYLNACDKKIYKIVLDSHLRISLKARLLKGADVGQVLIATTKEASLSKRKCLEKKGARVIVCPKNNGKIDLKALFKILATYGIRSVLIEGGACVVSDALAKKLVDVLHIYIAPKFMGDDKAVAGISGFVSSHMKDIHNGEVLNIEKIGKDVFIEIRM